MDPGSCFFDMSYWRIVFDNDIENKLLKWQTLQLVEKKSWAAVVEPLQASLAEARVRSQRMEKVSNWYLTNVEKE